MIRFLSVLATALSLAGCGGVVDSRSPSGPPPQSWKMAEAPVMPTDVSATRPQPGRWYLACSNPSNRAAVEFDAARRAAGQVTVHQLRNPGPLLSDHIAKEKLPQHCRHAVLVSPIVINDGVQCARDRNGELVILREIYQNGYIQVVIVADTQWHLGVPQVCKRRGYS